MCVCGRKRGGCPGRYAVATGQTADASCTACGGGVRRERGRTSERGRFSEIEGERVSDRQRPRQRARVLVA